MMNSSSLVRLMISVAVAIIFITTTTEARINLLDKHQIKSLDKSTHKSTIHDLKGRILLPVRSESGVYGDSNTYFVKLPPNQNYYSQVSSHIPYIPGTTHLRRLLPVNFASNGRPARVYHWNVPILRKMHQSQARHHTTTISGSATAVSSPPAVIPKSRRAHKKANVKKTTESNIYNIMPFNGQQKGKAY